MLKIIDFFSSLRRIHEAAMKRVMLKQTRIEDSCDILVILISGAGHLNFGDDAILSKWITVYRNYDIVLICGERIEQHSCLAIKKHVPLHLLDSEGVDEIKNLARNHRKTLVHLTGGGFCNDKFRSAPKIFSLLFQLQKFTTIIGTGVSFYPLSTDSKAMLNNIKFKYLSFRDFYSKLIYEGRSSPFYGDDLLPMKAPVSCRGKTLFINIQNQFNLVGKLSLVAKRVCDIVAAGSYSSVVLCELCPGDLDVLNYLDIDGLKVVERSNFCAENLKIASGDVFIGTRFHFRMLMENSGATGICIIADGYYSNKHEKTGPPCNFVPDRSVLMSIEEFVSIPFYFPDRVKKQINFRMVGKQIELILIKIIMRFGILR